MTGFGRLRTASCDTYHPRVCVEAREPSRLRLTLITMTASSPTRRTVSRVLTVLGGAVALGLVVFHASLLWNRLVDASIAQPGIIARWAASALLIAGLLIARRYARHRIVVLWVLIALLHAGIPSEQRQTERSIPLAVVVQIGFATMCGVLLAVLGASAGKDETDPTAVDPSRIFVAFHLDLSPSFGRSPPAL